MKLSTKGRYAMRAMLALAMNYGNGLILLKDIAGKVVCQDSGGDGFHDGVGVQFKLVEFRRFHFQFAVLTFQLFGDITDDGGS